MNKYFYFEKYGLKIVPFETRSGSTGIAFTGEPKYPNGYLIGIVSGHTPMLIRHYRYLTFTEEIAVIKSILKSGRENERYPLVDDAGQIAIYKDKSYVYDSYHPKGGQCPLGDLDSFDNKFDEEEEPIMVLPSSDMLGILEDYMTWKEYNKRKVR